MTHRFPFGAGEGQGAPREKAAMGVACAALGGEREDVFVEPAVNLPIHVDGWITEIRKGMAYTAFWAWMDGQKTIIARHIMRCEDVLESRRNESPDVKLALGELLTH